MRERIERHVGNIITSIIASWLSPILFIISFPVATFVGFISGIPPIWGYSLLSVVWVVSFGTSFIIVDKRRKQRIDRWEDVARMMYLADYCIRFFHLQHLTTITANYQTQYNDAIRRDIHNVLKSLLGLIAPHLPSHHKAVIFMIITPDGQLENTQFQVVEHANHEHRVRQHNQKFSLELSKSLAGQAILQDTCLVIRDHRQTKTGQFWEPSPDLKYYGHAAASVGIEQAHDERRVVGVLCMDFKQPYELNTEDRLIFTMCADKIGILWSKYQKDWM